uniref:Uncharacterized protein n=1 Tax=Plectus sambesii TaxID=2011161 RepID=A0A914VA91_9BILA
MVAIAKMARDVAATTRTKTKGAAMGKSTDDDWRGRPTSGSGAARQGPATIGASEKIRNKWTSPTKTKPM